MKSTRKTYRFNAWEIEIIFEEKVWRIPSSVALHQFIEADANHLNELYEMLQQDHIKMFGVPINITRSSFVVEIWAHLFVEKFLQLGKHFTWLPFLEKLYDQVTHHTSVIDCGEEDIDSNRRLWDMLAKVYNPVAENR